MIIDWYDRLFPRYSLLLWPIWPGGPGLGIAIDQIKQNIMQNNEIYFVPLMGLIGLIFMMWKARWVVAQDAGTGKMKEIATAIADGALAFLKAEWRVLFIFGSIVSVLLAWVFTYKFLASTNLFGFQFISHIQYFELG